MKPKEQELELMRRYLDGVASQEETRGLEALIVQDASVRREFVRYARLDSALSGNHRGALPGLIAPVEKQEARKVVAHRPGWFGRLRPLAAAAAGLVAGLFSASLVFAYSSPLFVSSKTVGRRLWGESFETITRQTPPGLPHEIDVWTGDEARVVTGEAGLKPRIGGRMLRFLSSTFAGEPVTRSGWGNVYRLVDLRGQVTDAASTLRLSAHFLGTDFPEGEEHVCFLELCALEDDPAVAPQPLTLQWVRENSASVAARKIPMKGGGVWQGGTVEMPVSAQTRFALVHLAVQRRKPLPSAKPVQFSGHYLDDVKLELRSQPHTARPE